MFTGIVETIGKIDNIYSRGEYKRLVIATHKVLADILAGDSIAVDGCCLTVIEINRRNITVEISPESANLTIIGNYTKGLAVNLERALLPSTRLGGHFVTGHIDGIGQIVSVDKNSNVLELSIRFSSNFTNHLVSKGSIAVNGISLTVNDIRNDIFTVNIIPYTRQVTTADNLKTGTKVNLEFDIIGKYILNYMQKSIKHQLTLDKLMQSGW